MGYGPAEGILSLENPFCKKGANKLVQLCTGERYLYYTSQETNLPSAQEGDTFYLQGFLSPSSLGQKLIQEAQKHEAELSSNALQLKNQLKCKILIYIAY